MKVISADYVVPISSPPIENGAVAVDGSEIVDVGALPELSAKFPDAQHDSFGEAAIVPGFVNCHSHLEITAMRGYLDDVEHDFRRWLLRLNDIRSALSDQDIEAAAIAGAIEGARAGVTCFGDIGRYGRAGLQALRKIGLRGVLFQETEFSPDNATADKDFNTLKDKFLALREQGTELVEVGLSPHAPYTVSRRLFEKIAEFAVSESIKTTTHASESIEEDDLVRNGKGFFIDVYNKFGLEWSVPGCSSIELLHQTGLLAARPLLAHCVTASDRDIELICSTGSRVAHCPKSNAKFGHGYAPLEKFLDADIAVGLGSDSVASNNMCDILEEARFAAFSARNRPGRQRFISAREALEAATLGGAIALGLEDKIGTLETGKQADIAVISISRIAQQPVTDIYASLVFSSNARDIAMTMAAGREIYREGAVTTVDECKTAARIHQIKKALSRLSA